MSEGSIKQYFPIDRCAGRGCDHCSPLCSWKSLWMGIFTSSFHQGGVGTCLLCHNIHSNWCRGEGSRSLGIDIGRASRLSPTSALARDASSPPRSSWRWGSSAEGHSRSSFPLTSPGLNQLASSCATFSVCHISGGRCWASSTLALHSRLSSVGEGALPSVKVTQHFSLEGLADWVHS